MQRFMQPTQAPARDMQRMQLYRTHISVLSRGRWKGVISGIVPPRRVRPRRASVFRRGAFTRDIIGSHAPRPRGPASLGEVLGVEAVNERRVQLSVPGHVFS